MAPPLGELARQRLRGLERNIMLQIPELLAPAGDLERLRYAINYGADAVYCALPEFGMRSAPTNFTPEQLTEGVIYAHARGRKVYLTKIMLVVF